jgi:hypothetical protein
MVVAGWRATTAKAGLRQLALTVSLGRVEFSIGKVFLLCSARTRLRRPVTEASSFPFKKTQRLRFIATATLSAAGIRFESSPRAHGM